MISSELYTIRVGLGMSQREFALALGLTGKHANRRIRSIEGGLEIIPDWMAEKVRNLEPEEAS